MFPTTEDKVYVLVNRYDGEEKDNTHSVTCLVGAGVPEKKWTKTTTDGVFPFKKALECLGNYKPMKDMRIFSPVAHGAPADLRDFIHHQVIPIEWASDFLTNPATNGRVTVLW